MIFLTDGQATSGETRTSHILRNIKRANEIKIPIFSLAFGQGADFKIVRMISAQNYGFGRRIYEGADAAMQISSLYEEISTVIMRNVKYTFVGNAINETSVTQTNFNTYFKGTELVVAGRYSAPNDADVIDDFKITCVLPRKIIDLYIRPDHVIFKNMTENRSELSKSVEKMWAYLTIKQWLKKMDATLDEKEQEALKAKITKKSLKVC